MDKLREDLTDFSTEVISGKECLVTEEYAVVPIELYDKFKKMALGRSAGARRFWANMSKEERSRIARERGRAGAAKRWNKK